MRRRILLLVAMVTTFVILMQGIALGWHVNVRVAGDCEGIHVYVVNPDQRWNPDNAQAEVTVRVDGEVAVIDSLAKGETGEYWIDRGPGVYNVSWFVQWRLANGDVHPDTDSGSARVTVPDCTPTTTTTTTQPPTTTTTVPPTTTTTEPPTTTTTTQPPTTTTTEPPTTTTTEPPTTTTTEPPTTTTQPPSTTTTTVVTTCDESSPTWNPETQNCELPHTGPGAIDLEDVAAGGLAFLALGLLGVWYTRRRLTA